MASFKSIAFIGKEQDLKHPDVEAYKEFLLSQSYKILEWSKVPQDLKSLEGLEALYFVHFQKSPPLLVGWDKFIQDRIPEVKVLVFCEEKYFQSFEKHFQIEKAIKPEELSQVPFEELLPNFEINSRVDLIIDKDLTEGTLDHSLSFEANQGDFSKSESTVIEERPFGLAPEPGLLSKVNIEGQESALNLDATSESLNPEMSQELQASQQDPFGDLLASQEVGDVDSPVLSPEASPTFEEEHSMLNLEASEDLGQMEMPVSEDLPESIDLSADDSSLAAVEEEVDQSPSVVSVSSSSKFSPSSNVSYEEKEDHTMYRYAARVEKEVKQKEDTIDSLKLQLEKLKELYEKSEDSRRHLQIKFEESENQRLTLEELRDQNKHHLNKIESAHRESLRDLQIRLDNSQFLNHKLEKKLSDFRERVKNDIIKIRARERDLYNKLEIQKRDAEALLSAKDERLLQHKREIDRLEYEIESLKEKIVEETQKAEERSAKLQRVIQSLRMAQGMLSGMEEEVVPTSQNDDGDKAA